MLSRMRSTISVCLLMAGLLLVGCGSSSNPHMELGGIDLGKVLDGLVSRTEKALASVKDQPTAAAASEELELISQDFDDLAYHVPKLPVDGQIGLTKKVSENLGLMEEMARMVNANPGLRDILGEQMNVLVEKMKGLMAL